MLLTIASAAGHSHAAEPPTSKPELAVLSAALTGLVTPSRPERRMAGTFALKRHGTAVGLTISTAAGTGGGYEASIDMGTPDCGGQIWGPVQAVSSTELVLSHAGDSGGDACRVHLRFDGTYESVAISEEGSSCSTFHGAQCEFGGTLLRHSK